MPCTQGRDPFPGWRPAVQRRVESPFALEMEVTVASLAPCALSCPEVASLRHCRVPDCVVEPLHKRLRGEAPWGDAMATAEEWQRTPTGGLSPPTGVRCRRACLGKGGADVG